MDDILSYALIATIGLGSTTIASAVVGDPLPVVLPAILAVLAVAGHYHKNRETDDQEATDGDVEQAISAAETPDASDGTDGRASA